MKETDALDGGRRSARRRAGEELMEEKHHEIRKGCLRNAVLVLTEVHTCLPLRSFIFRPKEEVLCRTCSRTSTSPLQTLDSRSRRWQPSVAA